MVTGIFAVRPVYAANGTGTLFIYSDAACTTLLSQVSSGNNGYILPSTGTTVYVKITGITESSVNTIELLWMDGIISHKKDLSTTVSGGITDCTAWVVGDFSPPPSESGITVKCGTTGVVFYGPNTMPNSFMTKSNGGSDGGHFYGSGTDSSGQCVTSAPEFPLGSMLMVAAALPAVLLLRRRVRAFRN